MRFNADNTATLQSLLTALGNGLSANTAYPILQQTIAAQQAAVEQRKQQMQAYGQQVAEMAAGGVPMGNATTMMDLLTPKPGVPGKVQTMLDTAYPESPWGQEYAPGQNYAYTAPENATPQQLNWEQPAELQQSPMYYNDPGVQAQQQQGMYDQAMQEIELQNALAPSETQQEAQALNEMLKFVATAKAQGLPADQITQALGSEGYGALVMKYWDKVQMFLA